MHRAHTPLLAALVFLAVSGALILLVHTDGHPELELQKSQSLYVDLPTELPQLLPASASSTEKVMVPIVVYHIVRPSYPGDSTSVRAMAHTPEVFDEQLKYLADAGYHVISFGDLERHFLRGAPLPPHPIIISFDDGWRDQFEYAFPVLKKYHDTATFFVFTNAIGRPGFISWEDLRTMRDAGMTIGSHSRSHPFLTKIKNAAALWDEIFGSKQILEKNLNISVREFAYPFGRYDATTTTMVEEAGYTAARGDLYYGNGQLKDQMYHLSAMNAPTTTALFARKFPAQSAL